MLLLLVFSRLERNGTSNVSTRRGFLRQAIGFVAAMSGLGASSCDGHKVAAPCPATRPNCGIVAIRGGVVAGGIHSLWETVRETPGDQGSWSTMAPVSTNLLPPGFWTLIDLDIAAVPRGSPSGCEESHVVLIPASGPSRGVFPGEVFYKRQLIDGTWTMGFETLSTGLGGGAFVIARPWRFGRISLARVNDELHACGITANYGSSTMDTGILAHTVRHFDTTLDAGGFERNQFSAWEDVAGLAGTSGTFVDVGCAGVRNPDTNSDELHVCAVSDDGRLWHSVRFGSTSWTHLTDVAAQAGSNGPFSRVDCAADGNLLHVVAVGQDGGLWYTIRGVNGWRAFEDVRNAPAHMFPFPSPGHVYDVAIGLWNNGLPAGQWQLIVVAMAFEGATFYTIRSSQPVAWQNPPGTNQSPTPWKPWTDLVAETAYTEGGGFTSATVATRPLLP